MIRPDLAPIAAKWIEAFRLQNRIIRVQYTRNLCVYGAPAYGALTIENRDEGRFLVEIQDPETWPSSSDNPLSERAIDRAVRHECGHILVHDFAPANPTEAELLAEERAVWALADAFDAVAEYEAPRVAAMAVRACADRNMSISQVAASVRAMAARTAATRRQAKGRTTMAMDPETAKMLLDALDSTADPAVAVAAVRKVVEGALTSGGEAPASTPEPGTQMPQGAPVDPSKDKMPDPNAMRAMVADMAAFRKAQGEIKEALDIVRPAAKVELVRAMRADGIELTPAQEQTVLNAPDVPTAKTLVAGMRAMAAPGTKKKQADPPSNGANLTRAQRATYEKMRTSSPANAEKYLAECVALNAAGKDGGK